MENIEQIEGKGTRRGPSRLVEARRRSVHGGDEAIQVVDQPVCNGAASRVLRMVRDPR